MVSKSMEWVSITALLLVVSWQPYANYQMLLRFLVCAGAVMMVLSFMLNQTQSRGSMHRRYKDSTYGSKSL
jgi:hypothetical protein